MLSLVAGGGGVLAGVGGGGSVGAVFVFGLLFYDQPVTWAIQKMPPPPRFGEEKRRM